MAIPGFVAESGIRGTVTRYPSRWGGQSDTVRADGARIVGRYFYQWEENPYIYICIGDSNCNDMFNYLGNCAYDGSCYWDPQYQTWWCYTYRVC